jgi:hypothetical protein
MHAQRGSGAAQKLIRGAGLQCLVPGGGEASACCSLARAAGAASDPQAQPSTSGRPEPAEARAWPRCAAGLPWLGRGRGWGDGGVQQHGGRGGGGAAPTAQQPPPFARGYARVKEYPLPPNIVALMEAYQADSRPPPALVAPLAARPMQLDSRRAGLLAVKAGMTQEWDEWGARVPLTVLWIDDCEVGRAGGRSVAAQACRLHTAATDAPRLHTAAQTDPSGRKGGGGHLPADPLAHPLGRPACRWCA